ncbi:MAG UNVERIFIED_CONTAM: tetratricopeptide repeat protein [Planctomycetaceae bacterium]|jgi:tetratricopeptide (TPR) repeat protein
MDSGCHPRPELLSSIRQSRHSALRGQGSKELALEDFSRAITAAPGEFAPRRNRADLHRELQNIPEALADFSEALRINPRDAETWFERGLLRLEMNDWNRCARGL